MSFVRFVSEFVGAAMREFLLRRPIHAEFTRSGQGQYAVRVSMPPAGEPQARQAEVHYYQQPPNFYPPVPASPWNAGWGNPYPYAAQPSAPRPPEQQPAAPAEQHRPEDHVVIPMTWRG